MSTTEQLARLIRGKLEIVEQIHRLTRRQRELVDDGEITDLLALLSGKQALIAQMQKNEKALDPFREEDPQSRHWTDPQERRKCAAQAKRCESLLAEILQLERESEQIMTERRDKVASQLADSHSAEEAAHAYGTPHIRAGRGIDLVSDH